MWPIVSDRERERRCFGLLRHTIALKRQWIWLAAWPEHTMPAQLAHAQFIAVVSVFNSLEVTKHLEGLKWFIYCFKESLLRYRQCESSMFTHVKGRSFCGSVGVWLRSEVNYIAADRPIGGQHALVQHWPCQTPHRRIVWMFALISSCSLSSGGLWPSGVFLGSEFFMMSSVSFSHTL